MVYSHLPNPRWEQNTYERFQYIYLFDYFRDRAKAIHYSNTIMAFQKKYHLKRRIPDYFDHLYGGSQWLQGKLLTLSCFLQSDILHFTIKCISHLHLRKHILLP